MSTPAKAEIVITAVDKATATINKISGRLNAATLPARNLASAVGGLALMSTGLAAVGVGAVGSLVAFANSAVNAADKIGDLSARYQINANALQVYGGLVEEAGGSTEDAAAAMGKLRKAMNEAVHGGAEQAAAFAGVGISVEALKKMSPEQVMLQMADAFKGSSKEGEKNAVLLQLMGKNGTIFMDVMNKGGAAYQQRLQEMRADGSLLTDEQLQQADEYDKTWSRLMRTLQGAKTVLGTQLAAALEPMVAGIQKWVVANRGLLEQKFNEFLKNLPGYLETAATVMQGLWGVVKALASVFSGLGSVLGPTGAALAVVGVVLAPIILAAGHLAFAIGRGVIAFAKFTQIIPVLAGLLRGLFAIFLANPIGLWITAVATLAYVIYKNWDGITAYVGAAWERIKSVFEVGFFNGLFQVWLEGWQAFGNAIVGIIKTLTPDFLLPDSLKNFKFTFATEHAQSVTTQAAQAQQQNIKNKVEIAISADGRPRVKELRAGSDNTTIDVTAGLYMAGA